MNPKLKKFLNNFEIYLGAVIFAIMTVLLFIQVVSRYVLGKSFTWTEEICIIFFVWMVYLGCAGAVTKRKHLCIDAFVSGRSFKTRKILLIFADVVFIIFSGYIIIPMMRTVMNYIDKHAASSILGIPKVISYGMMPLSFVLIAIRLVQDIIRLVKEEEHELGKSKPTIDIEAFEKIAEENRLKEANN